MVSFFAHSDPSSVHCESRGRKRRGVVFQPANTVSALAFLLVAGEAFRKGNEGKREKGGRSETLLLLAVSLVLLCVCTMLMHAFPYRWTAAADGASMYLLFAYLSLLNLGTEGRDAFFLACLLSGSSLLFPRLLKMDVCCCIVSSWIGTYFVDTTLPVWKGRLPTARQALGLLLLGAGLVAWKADSKVCKPDSLLQLHSAWHLLSAAGIYLVVGL